MNELSDYFRLKEIDRIEAEKRSLIALNKVIAICLKKDFYFSVNPKTKGITVSFDNFENSLDSYFKGELMNYSDGKTITIFELLEILKSK